jgi:hypothetical protein
VHPAAAQLGQHSSLMNAQIRSAHPHLIAHVTFSTRLSKEHGHHVRSTRRQASRMPAILSDHLVLPQPCSQITGAPPAEHLHAIRRQVPRGQKRCRGLPEDILAFKTYFPRSTPEQESLPGVRVSGSRGEGCSPEKENRRVLAPKQAHHPNPENKPRKKPKIDSRNSEHGK